MLVGRSSECQTLDRLVEAVRAGQSGALVVRGDAGIGKSALLDYLVQRASGCRVERAAGVQSEMELAFAALHQVCASMLSRLDCLPDPQSDALGTALGLRAGPPPDRFLVGLAVLSLLAEVAAEQPVLCVIDDAQWLDSASAQTLTFVARRLRAESVALVFAVRDPTGEWESGLPELLVGGLQDDAARVLLASAIRWPLDDAVRDRIISETGGNPLALLELPRGLTHVQLAGGFGLPASARLAGRIEETFRQRVEVLPPDSQRLLLIAAAEQVGDPVLVWSAARELGIGPDASAPAAAAELLEIDARVRFRHPLVRSAVYQGAAPNERREAHAALAAATDPDVDPDRRAWHRAHAAVEADEDVAGALERSAGRAQARGGLAAAAAFLRAAAGLTPDATQRSARALAAAHAYHRAGAFDAALEMLAQAQTSPLDEVQLSQVDLVQAQVAFALSRGKEAALLMLKAAKRLEPLDIKLARETYLEALFAALFADRLGPARDVAQAARKASAAAPPTGLGDLFLDGMVGMVLDDYAVAAPMLRTALDAFRGEDVDDEAEVRWITIAAQASLILWDFEGWRALCMRQAQLTRDSGALVMVPIALIPLIVVHVLAGELPAAGLLLEELRAVSEATGSPHPLYCDAVLAAWQGDRAASSTLIEKSLSEAVASGEGLNASIVQWASAVIANGTGRYEEALTAAAEAAEDPAAGHRSAIVVSTWALVELVEAAVRCAETERAAEALARLRQRTGPSGTDWALGIEARSRALLSDHDEADALYREALERLRRSGPAAYLARTHLVYGEWLRRRNRPPEAREQLRTAYEFFTKMGIEAFAERAAGELRATGETTHKRAAHGGVELTGQEAQVARLAGEGLSNPEIGTRLFISPRTVQYHLHKVFDKLDITSRYELVTALADHAAQDA